MCDVLLGVPGCVTKCDRGGGLKLAKNSMMRERLQNILEYF